MKNDCLVTVARLGRTMLFTNLIRIKLICAALFSSATTDYYNCPALTNLLTSNSRQGSLRQCQVQHQRLASMQRVAPVPKMSVKLVAAEDYRASELSHLSVVAGEQLWTELCCFSQVHGGWVWCCSPSQNKLGFLPSRCVRPC